MQRSPANSLALSRDFIGPLTRRQTESSDASPTPARKRTRDERRREEVRAAGLSLPADAESKYKAALSKLENLNGAAFDKAYMDDQVKDHEKTVNLFEREANSGKDPELKAFASKILPMLREHVKMSRDIRSTLTNKATS